MEQQPLPMYLEENITPELIAALSKAQAKFAPALKDANNPFFKSKYAPLDAVWNACKDALAENSLFVSQPTYMSGEKTMLRTRVYHSSGGFLSSDIEVIVAKKNDPQAFGSALTYFRRYSLGTVLGIVNDDDDAESAMVRDNGQNAAKPTKPTPQQQAPKAEEVHLMTSAQRTTIENLVKQVPKEIADKTNAWLKSGKPITLEAASEMIGKLNAAKVK